MARPTKRLHDMVDLTGDSEEDEQPQFKLPRSTYTLCNRDQDQRSNMIDDYGDEGGNEIMNLTQSVDESGIGFTPVGLINGKIVGIQYYSGYASFGESVIVRRDPSNPYDSNAIRIDNAQGDQVGHIPRTVAFKLAPYMDSRDLLVEGKLAGEKGPYDCPITLKLYGTSEPTARLSLEERIKSDRISVIKQKKPVPPRKKVEIAATGRKTLGFQGSQNSSLAASSSQSAPAPELTGPSINELIDASQSIKPRDMETLVEQWGSPEDTLASLPMAPQPERLQAKLLPYQLQGLAWMMSMENPQLPKPGSSDVVQLWKRPIDRPHLYTNIATNFTKLKEPALARGGILADDMGLGKTMQVISTIVQGGSGTTLIIAPVGVMSNWSRQIKMHVKSSNPLKVLTYHGSSRKSITAADLAKHDVVISTYGTLSTEFMPAGTTIKASISHSKTGLFSMKWKRIVLDEGHFIRNQATKSAIAACAIEAECRWVLTGTPIVNTIKDLHSMLKFLRITGGLEKIELFNSILTRPLSNGDENADLLLQTLMRTMCLRRKKDMKFVDLRLPELTEYVHRISFRKDERAKYETFQSEAQGMLSRVHNREVKYQNLLEIILRLRQVCCHWKLCGDRITKLLKLIESDKIVELSSENRLALQALLQLSIENSEECPVCLDTLHNPVITACKHVFGYGCIERVIQEQHKCPMCRAQLEDGNQLVHPAIEKMEEEDADIDVDTKSSKTEALMDILAAVHRDKKSKVVVFSQWTSFLNIIQHQVDNASYGYTRIDGSMPATARDTALAAFESDPKTTILLASLAVCSVGLNLVAADTVILADSWWAPAIEDQAVDRVHRLGQTRTTTVWRLVMEDSIEERVLDIQAEKRLLVGKAFKEKAKGDKVKTTRLADIKKLLG